MLIRTHIRSLFTFVALFLLVSACWYQIADAKQQRKQQKRSSPPRSPQSPKPSPAPQEGKPISPSLDKDADREAKKRWMSIFKQGSDCYPGQQHTYYTVLMGHEESQLVEIRGLSIKTERTRNGFTKIELLNNPGLEWVGRAIVVAEAVRVMKKIKIKWTFTVEEKLEWSPYSPFLPSGFEADILKENGEWKFTLKGHYLLPSCEQVKTGVVPSYKELTAKAVNKELERLESQFHNELFTTCGNGRTYTLAEGELSQGIQGPTQLIEIEGFKLESFGSSAIRNKLSGMIANPVWGGILAVIGDRCTEYRKLPNRNQREGSWEVVKTKSARRRDPLDAFDTQLTPFLAISVGLGNARIDTSSGISIRIQDRFIDYFGLKGLLSGVGFGSPSEPGDLGAALHLEDFNPEELLSFAGQPKAPSCQLVSQILGEDIGEKAPPRVRPRP